MSAIIPTERPPESREGDDCSWWFTLRDEKMGRIMAHGPKEEFLEAMGRVLDELKDLLPPPDPEQDPDLPGGLDIQVGIKWECK